MVEPHTSAHPPSFPLRRPRQPSPPGLVGTSLRPPPGGEPTSPKRWSPKLLLNGHTGERPHQHEQQQHPPPQPQAEEDEAARRAMERTLVRIYQREFAPEYPPQFAWPRQQEQHQGRMREGGLGLEEPPHLRHQQQRPALDEMNATATAALFAEARAAAARNARRVQEGAGAPLTLHGPLLPQGEGEEDACRALEAERALARQREEAAVWAAHRARREELLQRQQQQQQLHGMQGAVEEGSWWVDLAASSPQEVAAVAAEPPLCRDSVRWEEGKWGEDAVPVLLLRTARGTVGASPLYSTAVAAEGAAVPAQRSHEQGGRRASSFLNDSMSSAVERASLVGPYHHHHDAECGGGGGNPAEPTSRCYAALSPSSSTSSSSSSFSSSSTPSFPDVAAQQPVSPPAVKASAPRAPTAAGEEEGSGPPSSPSAIEEEEKEEEGDGAHYQGGKERPLLEGSMYLTAAAKTTTTIPPVVFKQRPLRAMPAMVPAAASSPGGVVGAGGGGSEAAITTTMVATPARGCSPQSVLTRWAAMEARKQERQQQEQQKQEQLEEQQQQEQRASRLLLPKQQWRPVPSSKGSASPGPKLLMATPQQSRGGGTQRWRVRIAADGSLEVECSAPSANPSSSSPCTATEARGAAAAAAAPAKKKKMMNKEATTAPRRFEDKAALFRGVGAPTPPTTLPAALPSSSSSPLHQGHKEAARAATGGSLFVTACDPDSPHFAATGRSAFAASPFASGRGGADFHHTARGETTRAMQRASTVEPSFSAAEHQQHEQHQVRASLPSRRQRRAALDAKLMSIDASIRAVVDDLRALSAPKAQLLVAEFL